MESTLLKTSNELADKMETRTSLEENPLESRVLTTMDAKLDLLKKHNDDSLTDMETRVTKKQKEDFENMTSMILDTAMRLNRLQEEFNE